MIFVNNCFQNSCIFICDCVIFGTFFDFSSKSVCSFFVKGFFFQHNFKMF